MTTEDLINEWRRFSLKEGEKETSIALNPDERKGISGNLGHSLVGKLLSNRIISSLAIKNAMARAWKTRQKFSIKVVGKNVFAFKFSSQKDRDWVAANGPWLFDRSLMVLEIPAVNQRISELQFEKVAFWLRLINLPMGFQNRCAAEKLGNTFDKFLEMEDVEEDLGWGDNIRIRVKIDISKPLRRGFMLKDEDLNAKCWITIRYERLPDFCFKCGRIGHGARECKHEDVERMSSRDKFEFGAWLKFQGYFRGSRNQSPPVNDEPTDLNGSTQPDIDKPVDVGNGDGLLLENFVVREASEVRSVDEGAAGDWKVEQVHSNDSTLKEIMEEDGTQSQNNAEEQFLVTSSALLIQNEGSSGDLFSLQGKS